MSICYNRCVITRYEVKSDMAYRGRRFKVSKRINVTVSDETYEELSLLADKQKRSVASLVNYLTTEGLEQAKNRGEIPKKEDK